MVIRYSLLGKTQQLLHYVTISDLVGSAELSQR